MTGEILFVKSRRVVGILIVLVAVAALGRALGPRGFLAGQHSPVPVPWAVFVPLVYAYAVASIAAAPMPWLEALAYRRVAWLSRLTVASIGVLAILLLVWSTARIPPPLSTMAAVRDFVGMLGLSLVCVITMGVTVRWIVPSGTLFSAVVLLHGELRLLPVDWLLREDGDRGALAVALVFFGCGIAALFLPVRLRRLETD